MNKDEEHLKLLVIFHYILAGLVTLFSLFPVLHLGIGLAMVFAPEKFSQPNQTPPPQFVGWLFAGLAGAFIIMGFVCALLVFLAGRSISKRKRYTFCLVIAGLECLMFPFGTALGVFSIIVLVRDSVKQLFNADPPQITG